MRGYRYGPARIDVSTEDSDAARWLHEFLVPWFEPCPPGAGGVRVELTRSAEAFEALARERAAAALHPHACFGLDTQLVELPGWKEAGGATLADDRIGCFYRLRPGRVEVVAPPGSPRPRIGLMRAVRELAALQMRAAPGCLDLHAAGFAVERRAVLLIGGKLAGKTTLLAHSLSSRRASLLANDRVFALTLPPPGLAVGVPTLVSIRPDTLERFPSLRSDHPGGTALLHDAEIGRAAADPGSAPASYALSPAQLARQLGAGTLGSAPIAAIVFPELSPAQPGWALARIAPAHAAARLRENLYGARLGPRPATVFEEIVRGAPAPRSEPAEAVERLAAGAPAFACRLGPDAYRPEAGDWLAALPLG